MLATFVMNLSKPIPQKTPIYIWYHNIFARFVPNFSEPKL